MRVNGQLVESTEEIAALSGYVQQTDLFVQCLTVRECLLFQVSASTMPSKGQLCSYLYLFKIGYAPNGQEVQRNRTVGTCRRDSH